jgi:MGT family glycosyltransferase
MPKALFFNVPAHGHVNPSLPLVAELVRRGHQITYFLTESYRAKVEATGAVFQPYTSIHDDYFDAPGLDGSRPQKAAHHLITTAAEILPELIEMTREAQPDYILFDGMCPWGQILPRIVGLPAVASLSLMAMGSPRSMMNLKTLRVIVPILMHDFDKGLQANQAARALGEKYHIAPLSATSIMNGLGDLSISYTSDYFQPYASTVSESVRFVGRIMDEKSAGDSFSFERVQDRPLIYVSLGSLINENEAFFRECIAAFRGSDYFVLMSTGNGVRPEVFGALPENITIHSWVPQIEVLKRAALFITHAGLGSVHDGLYFGVPLLLVPQQGEQTLIAQRVVELGAGLMLKKAQVNAESVRSNATRLLSDSRFKNEAVRIGETFRAAGGVARAADEIEALLRQRGNGA